MHDSDVKWNDAPIPCASFFFTPEAYEKYTISNSFGEKLAAKEEDIQSAAKASAEAAQQSAVKAQTSQKDFETKKPSLNAPSGSFAAVENVPEPGSTETKPVPPPALAKKAPLDAAARAGKHNTGTGDNVSDGGKNNPTGRSKKLAPPRFSFLTTAEQRTYLELYQKYSKYIPNQPNKNEVKDIQKFKDLQVRVHSEQQEFQDYLERAAHHTPEVYQYMHPDAGQFIQEWLNVQRARVHKYPRYYVVHDSVSLEPPKILKNPPPFQHIQTLLQVGEVPKAILPNMNLKIRPKVPVDYKKLKKRYPLLPGAVNKKVCSQDENLEMLAKKYGAKLAMSSSSLQCILDNQTLDKAWEIPVVVKSYKRKVNNEDVTEKLVVLDKPFPRRNMSEYEKNTRFYRLALKSYLLHPGHQKSLKFDKLDQPEPALHRVLETTAQESCFDNDEVDIADLETFGLSDMSPPRGVKEGPGVIAAKRHEEDSCTGSEKETSDDAKTVVKAESDADSHNASMDSSVPDEACKNVTMKKEESDNKVDTEETEVETVVPAHVRTAGQLRRSSRLSGIAVSRISEERKISECSSDQEIAEPKRSNENSEGKDGNSKKPRLSKSVSDSESDSGISHERPLRSKLTRSSGIALSSSDGSPDSSKSEMKAPITRKSLHLATEKSPVRKVKKSGSDDSEQDTSVDGKASISSATVSEAQGESGEDSKLAIDESKGRTQSKDVVNIAPKVTRRSSQLGVNADSEPNKKEESDAAETPTRRRTRRSALSVMTDSKCDAQNQDAVVGKLGLTATSFSDSQSDSDGDEDKLVIDEPKGQVSAEAASRPARMTRSRATSEVRQLRSPATSTRRSKRRSTDLVDDVLPENALTPKKTRSKALSSSPTRGEAAEPVENVKPEMTSPASPPSETENMQIETSPASPTMTDENETQASHLSSSPNHQGGAKIKEIPLSPPCGSLSPTDVKVNTKQGEPSGQALSSDVQKTSKDDEEAALPAKKNRLGQKELKDESTLDSILKAQSAMLQPERVSLSSSDVDSIDTPLAHIQISSQAIAKGADWIAAEKPRDFKSPENHNFTYNLWQLGNTPLIVRCSLHGNMRDKKQNMSYISVCPKLEYQYPYGVEQLTSSDVCRAWISSYLRNNCPVFRARINVSNSDVILLEKLNGNQVLPPRSTFNPSAGLTVLHDVLQSLLKLPEGNYLLSHTQDNAHAHIKQSVDRKGGVYDLHTAHTTYAETDVGGSPVVWLPVDPTIILPAHKYAGRVPATFDPKDSNRRNTQGQNKKKKKKKKKKGNPQT